MADEKKPVRKVGSVWEKPQTIEGDDRPASERVSSKPRPPVQLSKKNAGVQPQFRRSSDRLESPRRIRGGIKLEADAWPYDFGPWGNLIVSAISASVPNEIIQTAFNEYASRGQTRRLSFGSGVIEGNVQGRRYKAYELRLDVPTWSESDWSELIRSLLNEPSLGSRVLAGDAPIELISFVESMGLKLFPDSLETIQKETDSKEVEKIDKHMVCLLMLCTEAVARDPFVFFELRGLGREALIERMRQQKALDSSTSGAAPAYEAHPGEEGEIASGDFEDDLEQFWEAGEELSEVGLSVRKPEVPHALLRRLGPSPFETGKFPLVGVLATCYDIMSTHALEIEARTDMEVADGPIDDDDGDS